MGMELEPNGLSHAESELSTLVDEGRLIGFVAGVREGGRSRTFCGGVAAVDGQPMGEETVFPLSSNSKPLAGVLAMRLVELGVVTLDEPVDQYLPELAHPQVLARPDASLDDTVPSIRPITLRDLLTMTAGFGWAGESGPLAEAMAEEKIAPGPYAPPMPPDEYMRRLGALPLSGQPGDGWNYHNCSDVVGVLLSRASGRALAELLEQYVTGPLGLTDTGFTVDPARLPTSYGRSEAGGVQALDTATRFATPPDFPSLACGLTSTVSDYLDFLDVLQTGASVLGADSLQTMCTDQLTPGQREAAKGFIDPGCGYGVQVEVRPDGAVGWAGGLGTIGYANRRSGRSAVIFTTQDMEVDGTTEALNAVWTLLS